MGAGSASEHSHVGLLLGVCGGLGWSVCECSPGSCISEIHKWGLGVLLSTLM